MSRPTFHRQDSFKLWEETRSPKLASTASDKEAAAIKPTIPPARVHGFCTNFFADGEGGDIYSQKEILNSHAEFEKAFSERVGGGDVVQEWGSTLSPSPITIPRATLQELAQLQGVLSAGLAGVLQSWGKEDSWVQKAMPLPPKAKSLLLKCAEFAKGLPDTKFPVGSFRPDVLIGADGRLQVCDINAQFTLDGFFKAFGLAEAIHTLPTSSVLASLALSAVPSTQSLLDVVADRFDSNETLFVLVGEQSTQDLAVLEQIFKKNKGCPPVCFVDTKQLEGGTAPGALTCMMDGTPVMINQCILELNQAELLALSDPVLEGLLELSVASKCLNPIWTILLANDKRMLGVLRTLTEKELPDKQARAFLKKHIIPTRRLENIEALERLTTQDQGLLETSLVAKPCLSEKGEGIILEKDFETPELFVEAVSKAVDGLLEKAESGAVFPYIVQSYFEQEKFNVIQPPSCDPSLTPVSWHVVGSLLCLDDQFLGPGTFRSSKQDIVCSTSAGGMTIAPALLTPTPPHVRYAADTINDLPFNKVKETLLEDGIVLLCLNKAVSEADDFTKFIAGDLGAVPHTHSDDVDGVWSIQPKSKGIARSHTADAFLPHTDASFEPVPPRFFALSVIRADQGAGGLLCNANVTECIEKLSEEDVEILETTMVRIKRPIEFVKEGMETTVGPVLFSKKRARIRGDIIMTDHLPKDVAEKFWAAYNRFYGQLFEMCHESARLMPERSMIIMDNHRFVHARTAIKDWRRSLLRIRFDIDDLPEKYWE